MKKLNDLNKIFHKLKGEIIQEIKAKINSDQHFQLITNRSILKFGANDLGVWVDKYETKKTPRKFIQNKNIEEQIKEIIGKFIDLNKYEVFIFGSRITEKARKYSDYDIGIRGKRALPAQKIVLIKEALEESDLPCQVDVVDFYTVSADFKNVAMKKIKKL